MTLLDRMTPDSRTYLIRMVVNPGDVTNPFGQEPMVFRIIFDDSAVSYVLAFEDVPGYGDGSKTYFGLLLSTDEQINRRITQELGVVRGGKFIEFQEVLKCLP